ncbi:MAG: hypothetical protein V7739_00870 [Motiliproteus sp.]
MMRAILVTLIALLLAGCEPSFKDEYEAVKKELAATKLELTAAHEKLKAADNEIRHKIFSLIRSANNHLQSTDIDMSALNRIQQELQVHIDSYTQLTAQQDHVSITSNFYREKLISVMEILKNSRLTYNRRYNECLSSMDEKGGKNDISSMLCEVQADMAKEALTKELKANIKALLTVSDQQLLAGRRAASSTTSTAELETLFNQHRNQLVKRPE